MKAKRIQYSKLVPGDTLIGNYLSFMEPLETARSYDFWSACLLISAAVGRTIVIDRGGAPIYLNLFTILVAESGITRKSTAVRHATTFLRSINSSSTEQQGLFDLIETKITPELLEEKLAVRTRKTGRATAIISISELVTFLGREKYVSSMPTLLTDLYDCPAVRSGGGSLGTGARDLENVFVSFMSASTPSWLVRAVNPDVIEGGFTSRVMFIVANEPKRRSPWPEPQDEQLREQITRSLVQISDRAKEVSKITISDGGRKAFEKWYRTRIIHRDPFRNSFQSREDAHILRLAAFFCINDDTWHIQHHHVVNAIKCITEVREDGAAIFEGTGTNSRLIVGMDKLRDKLLSAGLNGAPQRELTKAVSGYMDAEIMRTTLDIMHELRLVQRFEVPPIGRGRPATLWRATSALASSTAIDQVIGRYGPERP